MRIDLFYYTPYLNNYYFVYGPEKDSHGDIIIKGTGYYFADADDMVAKLRSMADSLAPEITNVQARTQGNSFWIYVGDLNTSSSESPDYTQVLTNINTNLTDLNSNLSYTVSGTSKISLSDILAKIFYCLSNSVISGTTANIRNNSFIKSLDDKFKYSVDSTNVATTLLKILSCLSSSFANIETVYQSNSGSYFKAIQDCLKQSVSPNANITDVISALNATIDSKQDTTIVNNEVTPLAEINIDVPFEVKNLKKSDVEN